MGQRRSGSLLLTLEDLKVFYRAKKDLEVFLDNTYFKSLAKIVFRYSLVRRLQFTERILVRFSLKSRHSSWEEDPLHLLKGRWP